jgi:hypothetical protein
MMVSFLGVGGTDVRTGKLLVLAYCDRVVFFLLSHKNTEGKESLTKGTTRNCPCLSASLLFLLLCGWWDSAEWIGPLRPGSLF